MRAKVSSRSPRAVVVPYVLVALAAASCGSVREVPSDVVVGDADVARLWTRPDPSPENVRALSAARRLAGLGRPGDAFDAVMALLDDPSAGDLEAERFLQDLLAASQADAWIRRRAAERLAAAPDDADAWYLAARIEPSRERQAAQFEEALRRDPLHPYARLGRAIALERSGDRRAAVREARGAAAAGPRLSLPWLFLGASLWNLGEDASAVGCFAEASARDPLDPRPWLGLVAVHDDAGSGAQACAAALEALRRSPGDPGILIGTARVLERRGSPDDLRAGLGIVDAVLAETGDPAVVQAFRGRCLLGLGRADEAVAALAEAERAGWGGEVHVALRRARVAAGRPDDAVRGFLSVLPSDAATEHPLARYAVPGAAGAAGRYEVARAFVASGWCEEALLLLRGAGGATSADGADRPHPETAAAALAADTERFLGFLRALGDYGRELRRDQRRGRTADLDDVLGVVGELSRRHLGADASAGAAVRSYDFLGSFAVSTASEGPFADAFGSRGLVALIGERSGAGADFMVGRLVRRFPDLRVEVEGTGLSVDEHWIESDGLPDGLAGLRGGLAGLTLDRWVFVHLDAVRRGPPALPAGLPFERRAAVDANARFALDTPSLVARRIERLACGQPDGSAVLDAVRRHEYVHVLDASRMVPVWAHPLRCLAFAIAHGFDAASMERTLEARAAVGALVESREPRAALAALVSFLPSEDADTPHAAAYVEVVAEAVRILTDDPAAFPSIDPAWNVLQQFDRLGPDEVRELGRRLRERR